MSKQKESAGICDSNPTVKVAFCERVLHMTYFGFKFKNWDDEALICEPNLFWIIKRNTFWKRRSKKPKEKHYRLEMYVCPDIFYTDLESEIDIPIDERYYVSRGHEENSAILFVQKHKSKSDDKIYPQKYVEDIIFHTLALPQRAVANLSPQIKKPDITANPISIEEELIAYGQTIKLTKPYEKFLRTFFSLNICGKRKSHKVYICRESIRDVYGSDVELRFDEDYDDASCRKRIKIQVHIWNDANFNAGTMQNMKRSMKKSGSFYKVREVSLFFLHCPRMMPTNKNDFVYLASNLRQRSVIFYMRANDPVEYFDMTAIVNELNTEKMAQDNRRTRYKTYPLKSERQERILELTRNYLQELEENINYSYSSVQTPMMIAKVDGNRLSQIDATPKPVQLIQKRRLVEDIVIKYAEIKTMLLPYKRFEMTYRSLDICELPTKLKTALCEHRHGVDPDEVDPTFYSVKSSVGQLSDDESYYTPKEGDTDQQQDRCTRNEIHLAIREIENLKARSFVMWKCPTDRGFPHMPTYFIAKCHLKNTALVFRTDNTSEGSENRIYSVAVVTKIDRDSLALIVFFDNIL